MPMYDIRCNNCGAQRIDVWQAVNAVQPTCACGGQFERAWLTKPANVIGDECDVWVEHGICNPDGTPRRYRSKIEMRREAKTRGWTNAVQHIEGQGSDKSPHTSRWI